MSMKEFEFLDHIRSQLRGEKSTFCDLSLGDDCAVFQSVNHQNKMVVTTDHMVEGVHFRWDWISPRQLGEKLVSVNLSDIAAMGAKPLGALCNLALPPDKWAVIDEIEQGIIHQCHEHEVDLLGGDTTNALDTTFLGLTILGQVGKGDLIYRSGARERDLIFCSGTMGGAALALTLLRKRKPQEIDPVMLKKWTHPKAQVRLGLALSQRKLANAMIDVSDGLFQDLRHLLRESGVSAKIEPEQIPLPKSFLETGGTLELAMTGGEDYQLLFTVASEAENKVLQLARELNMQITRIGHCVAVKRTPGEITLPDSCTINLKGSLGFQHGSNINR